MCKMVFYRTFKLAVGNKRIHDENAVHDHKERGTVSVSHGSDTDDGRQKCQNEFSLVPDKTIPENDVLILFAICFVS